MKSVLISIKPYWVFLIIAKLMGWNIPQEKTVEVRKSYPKADNWNKVAKIYCSKDKRSFSKIPHEYQPLMERFLGKVIGEFVCDRVYQYASDMFRSTPVEGTDISTEDMTRLSCLTAKELYEYEYSAEPKEYCIYLVGVYGWHISDLAVYDEPKELNAFYGKCNEGCEDCYLWQSVRVNADEFDMDCASQYYGYIPLKRPPQSWCYVEAQP